MPVTSWTPQNVYRPVIGGFKPAAVATKTAAVKIAPKRTGRLARATQLQFTGPLTALLVNRVPYIYPVVKGAQPHPIGPATKQALTVGNKVYENVHHPGQRGNPFLNIAATGFSIVYAAEVRRRFH